MCSASRTIFLALLVPIPSNLLFNILFASSLDSFLYFDLVASASIFDCRLIDSFSILFKILIKKKVYFQKRV
ncbi:hypothetical protein [Methanobrevibacter boviskoreani]|uniref:hypothetical protein n=1 Tax=Methanobrevibacter boviskoreani TaxID=1348249 RepID=UPI0023A8BC1F|nr:hypothetical protein [Methanobrevibacter boviskoreani]